MQYTTISPKTTLKKGSKTPIYRSDGKVIGKVIGDTFHKRINGSKHLLLKPPAIALSVESLAQAEQAGARKIEITDKNNGCIYSCTFEHFKHYSWELQRGGFERQRALALGRWDVTGGRQTAFTKVIPTEEAVLERVINQPVQLALL